MERVEIRMNEERLLASLRYAFTNQYTVVSELMQNARRAKATRVLIEYDAGAERLAVRDDGIGIADFQKLFTVGESGWDEATAAAEHAFGMGFMKSLYSARHCTVRSKGRAIAFDTAAALKRVPIEVKAIEADEETVVILEGVKLAQLPERMALLACGFPIPVLYNGAEMERPFALDRLRFVETGIGHVHLAGTEDGKAVTSTLLLLQGFPVKGEPRYAKGENIVHLDPARFAARLPDREKLIDEEGVVREVEAVLREMWRARLAEAKEAFPSEAFVERYFDAASRWGAMDLFDDVPVLPGRLFDRIAGYPIQEGYSDAHYLKSLPGLVRREAFESGALKVVELASPDGENCPAWMFARAKGLRVLARGGVTRNHWLWSWVTDLDQARPEVEIVGERARARLHGQWIAPEVVICRAYRVRIGGEEVEITDEAVFVSDGDLILVPDGEAGGAVAEQCSSFIDGNDHWHEDARDTDREALDDLILRLRATDPAEAMRSLIADLRLEKYPSLRGRTFTLRVSGEGGRHEVQMVA